MASPSAVTAALQAAASQFADTLTRLAGSLTSAATPLIATVNSLNASMAAASAAVAGAAPPLIVAATNLGGSFAALSGTLTSTSAPLTAALAALQSEAATLAATMSAIAAPVQTASANLGSGLANAGNSLRSAAGPLLAVANSLGAGLGAMAGRILDMVVPGLGTLAETLINLPQKLLSAVEPFVSALNPALLIAFNMQLANLQATIGTAFEDVFSLLAPVLDQVASLIQSVMDSLRPMIDALTTMFGSYLVEVTRNFVSEMKLLMPVIEAVMSILQVLMTVFELMMAPLRPIIEVLGLILKVALMPLNMAMQALFKVLEPVRVLFDVLSALAGAVVDVVGELIQTFVEGLGIGDLFKKFADTVKEAILNIISAIAKFLASLPFGWGKAILEAWSKREAGTAHAIAAPKDVSIRGIEEIMKGMTVAAFTAGAGKQEENNDILSDIRRILDDAVKEAAARKEGPKDFKERFERAEKFNKDKPWLNLATFGLGGWIGGAGG